MGLLLKLKEGDTNLKSLKYGNDRPNGGSSSEPFIQTPIPDDKSNITGFIDGDDILRGGVLAPVEAAEDSLRLTKYLFDLKSPQGFLFTAKQNLLSRIAPETEASFGLGYAGGQGQPGSLNAGIYNPLTTISQASVGFLGDHLNERGLDPTGKFPQASIKNYEGVVFDKNVFEKNRMFDGSIRQYLSIENDESPLDNPSTTSFTFGQVENGTLSSNTVLTNRLLKLWDKKGLNIAKPVKLTGGMDSILSYGGGPGSILGAGYTNIKFSTLNDGVTPARTGINKISYYTKIDSENIFTRPDVYYSPLNIFKGGNFTGDPNKIGISYTLYQKYPDKVNEIFGAGWSNTQGDNYISSIEEGDLLDSISLQPWDDNTTLLGARIQDSSTRRTPVYRPFNIFSGNNFGSNNTGQGISYLYSLDNPDIVNNLFGTPGSSITGEDYLNNIRERKDLDDSNLQPWLQKASDRLQSTEESTRLIYSQRTIDNRNKRQEENKPRYGGFNVRQFSDYGSSAIKGKQTPTGKSLLASKRSTNLVAKSRRNGELKDLVTFTIKLLPGASLKDDFNKSVQRLTFPALIEGYNDNYNTNFTEIQYMGRPEPFFKYSGFKRNIGFSFTVVAQSKQEMGAMYSRLNALASSVAPSYTSAGYMNGNIAYITLGDVIVDQPGIIGGFSISIPEETSWDIGIYNKKDGSVKGDGAQLPMMLKVNGFTFTPLYKSVPQFGTGYWIGSSKVRKLGMQLFRSSSTAFTSTESEVSQTNENSQNQQNINQSAQQNSTGTAQNVDPPGSLTLRQDQTPVVGLNNNDPLSFQSDPIQNQNLIQNQTQTRTQGTSQVSDDDFRKQPSGHYEYTPFTNPDGTSGTKGIWVVDDPNTNSNSKTEVATDFDPVSIKTNKSAFKATTLPPQLIPTNGPQDLISRTPTTENNGGQTVAGNLLEERMNKFNQDDIFQNGSSNPSSNLNINF